MDDGYIIPRPSSNASIDDIVPVELVILLTTLCLSPQEFEQRRSKNKPPKPVMENDQAALLYKVLQNKQAQYATSLDQDVQMISTSPSPAALEGSPRRLRMALAVRIGEKEILMAVLAILESTATNGSLKRAAEHNGDESRKPKAARV